MSNDTVNDASDSCTITYELLTLQNAETSNAIIQYLESDESFQRIASKEGMSIEERDKEDDSKLQKGIQYAIDKGVLDKDYVPESYTPIDVVNKTPTDVATSILQYISEHNNSNTTENSSSYVIVLVGLSGTGKGTTVTVLKSLLEHDEKQVITWSNGNLFRTITLYATTYWENYCLENNISSDTTPFNPDIVLTPTNIQSFMKMISFVKHPTSGKYDIQLVCSNSSSSNNNNGIYDPYDQLYVSDIQNTTLKSSSVSKCIPTVAEMIQGEVIQFAANAIEMMCRNESNLVVLLEGREQTVNYIRSPYRFELVLRSNPNLIGQRRAAQRIMALAIQDPLLTSVAETSNITTQMIHGSIHNAIQTILQE